MRPQIGCARLVVAPRHDDGGNRLLPLAVGATHHGRVGDLRMAPQHVLDLPGSTFSPPETITSPSRPVT